MTRPELGVKSTFDSCKLGKIKYKKVSIEELRSGSRRKEVSGVRAVIAIWLVNGDGKGDLDDSYFKNCNMNNGMISKSHAGLKFEHITAR